MIGVIYAYIEFAQHDIEIKVLEEKKDGISIFNLFPYPLGEPLFGLNQRKLNLLIITSNSFTRDS